MFENTGSGNSRNRRGLSGSVREFAGQPLFILAAAFLVQWALLHSIQGPTWDAAFYYVLARSPVFDQDLRLENDLRLSYPTATSDFTAKEFDTDFTDTGRIASPFAIGTPLLWLPLMMLVKILASLIASPGAITGFEWPFVAVIATFSAFSAFFAFWLAFRIAQSEVGRFEAKSATLALMFATPLLYYQFREPMYSHTSSALTATLCVYAWWRKRGAVDSIAEALGLGALFGLAGLTRWQNMMYLVLPFITTISHWFSLAAVRRKREWKRVVAHLTSLFTAAAIIFLLQMAVWKIFNGSWITVPQGSAYVDWGAPFVRQVLFSTFRGLLPWMPVIFLALVGLISMCRQRARLILPLLIVLCLETYVNSSSRDWFGGGGYGPRRYTSELVIMVVGFAGFLRMIPSRARTFSAFGISFGLAVHQWLLLRYGTAEKIGGRVLSMYPTYHWEDGALGQFVQDLMGHVPDALKQPLDFVILPASPLHLITAGRVFPFEHVASLLMAACIIFFGVVLWHCASHLLRRSIPMRRTLILLAAFLAAAANLWVLKWS